MGTIETHGLRLHCFFKPFIKDKTDCRDLEMLINVIKSITSEQFTFYFAQVFQRPGSAIPSFYDAISETL